MTSRELGRSGAGPCAGLRYWYRESAESLSGISFHDDLLTLGLTTPDDPPRITSGMIYVELDPRDAYSIPLHARAEAG